VAQKEAVEVVVAALEAWAVKEDGVVALVEVVVRVEEEIPGAVGQQADEAQR